MSLSRDGRIKMQLNTKINTILAAMRRGSSLRLLETIAGFHQSKVENDFVCSTNQ